MPSGDPDVLDAGFGVVATAYGWAYFMQIDDHEAVYAVSAIALDAQGMDALPQYGRVAVLSVDVDGNIIERQDYATIGVMLSVWYKWLYAA